MRFKAQVKQPAALMPMLSALSHMSKECLIVLCREQWKFMINEKYVNTTAHPQCYASTPIANIFDTYRLDSKSNNEILLQVNIRNLLAGFRSARDFNGTNILRLTKKNDLPVLSFEMWEDDGEELRINVIQDVSVRPIQHSKLYLYEEPTLDGYHASSNMPPLRSIRTVIEKMRAINGGGSGEQGMLFINNDDGKLMLQIQTDHCALKTIYQNLGVSNMSQSSNGLPHNVSARLSLRFLAKVISSLIPLELHIQQAVVAITKATCVTIHARLVDRVRRRDEDGDEEQLSARITFYLCVYVDDEEESSEDEEEEEEEESDQTEE